MTENKETRQAMINSILKNSYIELENINDQSIIDFDLITKLSILECNVYNWIPFIKENEKRLYSTDDNVRYNFFCIKDSNNINYLTYAIIGETEFYKRKIDLQKDFNKIDFKLIDKLIEYKNNNLTIDDIAEHIKHMK